MITILGAAGFIGSNLARRLLYGGHDVRVVDCKVPSMPYRREAWDGARERVVADMRDLDQAAHAIRGSEWVFHLAADVGGVGYLSAHDYVPFFNNMSMSMNALYACEHLGVERMFFASSSCIYPQHLQEFGDGHELEERDAEFGYPDLMYGREKLMTLRLCERAPFDARVGIVNTTFGPGLDLTGERMKYPAAITARAVRSIRDGVPLDIWGDGSQVRGYLHVDDWVDKALTIMTEPYDGPVNITSIETASCTDVALMVLDILGHPEVPLRYVDGPTGPMYRHVSNAKWEATYGPDGQRSLRAAFGDFVPWVVENL